MRTRIAVVFFCALVSACRRGGAATPVVAASSPTNVASRSWIDHGMILIRDGKCEDLRALLVTVPEKARVEEWYELRGLGEASCWSHSHSETDKTSALSAFDAGMARYPNSALLIADEGAVWQTFGDSARANKLYEQARLMALANLKRNPQSRYDRYVVRRTEKALGLAPSPLPAAERPADSPPTQDLQERSGWQGEAWRFITKDDCKGAIRFLTTNQPSRPTSDWYAMYSQADALCWQDGLGDAYKVHGLKILDDGLQAVPESPRLYKSKAEYFELIGNHVEAQKFAERAKESAKSWMSSPAGGEKREEAEEVLRELGADPRTP